MKKRMYFYETICFVNCHPHNKKPLLSFWKCVKDLHELQISGYMAQEIFKKCQLTLAPYTQTQIAISQLHALTSFLWRKLIPRNCHWKVDLWSYQPRQIILTRNSFWLLNYILPILLVIYHLIKYGQYDGLIFPLHQ